MAYNKALKMNNQQAIELPYNFEPYDYQRDTMRAIILEDYKNAVIIRHRRGGKTIEEVNTLLALGMKRVGLHLHSFPSATQARSVCFDAMDYEGVPFLDRIPSELMASDPNKTRMEIKLVNGSILKWIGTDNFNSKMGSNAVTMIYDEYSLQKEEVRYMMNPIFKNNGGTQIFVYTPRGKNHGYDLMNIAKKDPSYYLQMLTVDQTFKHDGSRVVPQSIIDADRREGIPEEIIQQEYYLSFDASLVGNFYGDHIKVCKERGRILDFEINTRIPVYTFWDLGGAKEGSDETAIWFLQKDGANLKMIYYYETNLTPLYKFPNTLADIAKELGGIRYAKHYAPCDINVVEFGSGKSRINIAKQHGLKFEVLPGHLWNKPKIDGIECAWRIFSRMWFHETNCAQGLRALNEYRKEWDNNRKCYKPQPLHDWCSHAADAFRYFALIWTDSLGKQQRASIIDLAANTYRPLN